MTFPLKTEKLRLYSALFLLYLNPKTSTQAWRRFDICFLFVYSISNVDIFRKSSTAGKERYFSTKLLCVHAPNLVCALVLLPFDPLDALGKAREQ